MRYLFFALLFCCPAAFSESLSPNVLSYEDDTLCFRIQRGVECIEGGRGGPNSAEPVHWKKAAIIKDDSEAAFFGLNFFVRRDGLLSFRKKNWNLRDYSMWLPYSVVSRGILDVKFSAGVTSGDATVCLKNTEGRFVCLSIKDGQLAEKILETEPEVLDLKISGKKIFYRTASSVRLYEERHLVFQENQVHLTGLSSDSILYAKGRTVFKYSVKNLMSESVDFGFTGYETPELVIPLVFDGNSPTVFLLFKDRYELWGPSESKEIAKKEGLKGSLFGRKEVVTQHQRKTLLETKYFPELKLVNLRFAPAGGRDHDIANLLLADRNGLYWTQVRPGSSYEGRSYEKSVKEYVYSSKSSSVVETSWTMSRSSLVKAKINTDEFSTLTVENIEKYLYSFDAKFMESLLNRGDARTSGSTLNLLSDLAELFAKKLNYPALQKVSSEWPDKKIEFTNFSVEANQALAGALLSSISSVRSLMSPEDMARLAPLVNELATYQIEGQDYKNLKGLQILIDQSREIFANYMLHPYLAARVPVQFKIADLLIAGLR